MKCKRIGRTLVCLLVVLCLIINISPIRAQATGLGGFLAGSGSVMSVPGLNVCAAVLIGLGICAGVSLVDWDSIVINCHTYLKNEGIIDEDGKIDVLAVPGVSYVYGVAQDVVEMIRSWLLENEIVTLGTIGYQGTSAGYYQYNATGTYLKSAGFPLSDALRWAYQGDMVAVYGITASYMYGFFFNAAGRLFLGKFENPYKAANAAYCTLYPRSALTLKASYIFGTQAIYGSKEDAYALTNFLTTACYVFDWNSSSTFSFSSGAYATFPVYSKTSANTDFGSSSTTVTFRLCSTTYSGVDFGSTENLYLLTGLTLLDGFVSDYDVGIAQIADPDIGLSAGYATWAEGVVAVPGSQVGSEEETVTYWPISLGQTYEDTSSLTQEEVWAGTSTYTPSASEKYPGTFADTTVGSFIDGLVDSIAGIFTPSTSPDVYAISLTDFFPFCIPFDIYEFLSLLAAEPEAPVFEWVIPVPQLDQEFTFTVDLSAWDGVAWLVRKLELLGFILGLAYVTRDKFIRG